MNSEVSDVADRLDLSVSSIDMTNTSLFVHEEKDSDISGIGVLSRRKRLFSSRGLNVNMNLVNKGSHERNSVCR